MQNKIIFTLSNNVNLVDTISKKLNIPVGHTFKETFSDGEILIKTLDDVENKDVILVESTFNQPQEHLFEIMLLLDSFKRAKAKSVQLFIPYFGYSRQEKSYDVEPISCEVVAKILETGEYNELLTLDLHHSVIKTFFKKPFTNIMTTELFKEYYLSYFNKNNINIKDVILVAPDHGSNVRANALANELGVEMEILTKYRPKVNVAEHLEITDNKVKDKICIIFDDIIDTGGTIASATKLLYAHGAKKVLVGATHGIFSGECIDKLLAAGVFDITVTNTIEQYVNEVVNYLDISPLIIKNLS